MSRNIKRAVNRLDKKEDKLLTTVHKENIVKAKIYEKVPDGLRKTLEAAFIKAFELVFVKGTSVIEKTFNKEDICLEFEANNYILDKKETRKNVRRLDKFAQKSNFLNRAVTTTSGMGLGILGIGIPDIPLLVATLLKGVYEIALSYGFSYDCMEEKIYILRLIRVALCSDDKRVHYNSELDTMDYSNAILEDEIKQTAHVLADALLVEKFIQGIPLIGIIGAVTNNIVYKKVTQFSVIKYKKRYLENKMTNL